MYTVNQRSKPRHPISWSMATILCNVVGVIGHVSMIHITSYVDLDKRVAWISNYYVYAYRWFCFY